MKVKTKAKIARFVSFGAFLYCIGIVGGMEKLQCGVGQGMIRIAIGMLVCFCAAWKGGLLR